MKSVKFAAVLMTIGLALFMASNVAAQLKSPDDVKTGLRLLMQVSNDFKRQITAKNFARVPREFKEFTESSEAVRTSVKDEPAAFKDKVETRLKATIAAYQKVSDMSSTTTDADMLMAEHTKAVAALNTLFDLFPLDLRPDPNAPAGIRGAPKN